MKGFTLEKSLKQRKTSQSHTGGIKTYHINSAFPFCLLSTKESYKKNRTNMETQTYGELEFCFVLLHIKNENLHKAAKAF